MATTTLMTWEQFLKLEEEPGKTELLEGEVIHVPPAKLRHMEIVERFYELLKGAVEHLSITQPALRLGRVHMEMGYLLMQDPRSWLIPDVSITQFEQARGDYYEGSPLFAFEVVSPDDRVGELTRKVQEFLKHGAAEVWLIFPDQRYAQVYERGASQPRIEAEAVRSALLPGIEISFAKLFE